MILLSCFSWGYICLLFFQKYYLIKILSSYLYVCVCVSGYQSVECIQIMMWWSSNLGKWTLRHLGYVAYCYTFILVPPRLSFLPPDVLTEGASPSSLKPPPPTSGVDLQRIFPSPGCHLSPSQHTYVPCLSFILRYTWSPPPTLPLSGHAYQIPVTYATFPLPKSLLPWPSEDSLLPPTFNTAPGVSPLTSNLSLCHKRQK